MRLHRAVASGVLLLATVGACRNDTVQLTYRPQAGDRSEYEVTVRSESVVEIAGQPEQRQVDRVVLIAEHRVLDADPDGSRVRVRLRPEGAAASEAREFVVRFDRAAQLAEVQEVEGLPAIILGDLGLAEIFPAAAGTPPDRRLEAGERWKITSAGEGAPSSGRGRLAELRIDDGTEVGIVETATDLPVTRTGRSPDGLFRLDGEQHTDSRTAHDLTDGSVRWSEAETVGRYTLTLTSADGDAPVVTGSLRVVVESTTERLP